MQVDYDFVEAIHKRANLLADTAIRATYSKDINHDLTFWSEIYNQYEAIIRKCDKQMEKMAASNSVH